MGLFLEAVADSSGVLAPRRCSFLLSLLRPDGPPLVKHTQHEFTAAHSDWCAWCCGGGAVGSPLSGDDALLAGTSLTLVCVAVFALRLRRCVFQGLHSVHFP